MTGRSEPRRAGTHLPPRRGNDLPTPAELLLLAEEVCLAVGFLTTLGERPPHPAASGRAT